MITKEDVEKLKLFIERGDRGKIARKAKVGNTVVTDFFQYNLEFMTTDVQIRIIDASLELIDEKNKMVELASSKIKSL